MDNQTNAETIGNKTTFERGRKLVLIVFIIWAAQAIPKWSAAIMADDETSAKIIGYFITPMSEVSSKADSS